MLSFLFLCTQHQDHLHGHMEYTTEHTIETWKKNDNHLTFMDTKQQWKEVCLTLVHPQIKDHPILLFFQLHFSVLILWD